MSKEKTCKKCKFAFTSDNEALALAEVELQIKNAGLKLESDLEKIYDHRKCQNAFGKDISEDEFESQNPESDEAWFDDHDYIFSAVVSVDGNTAKLDKALADCEVLYG